MSLYHAAAGQAEIVRTVQKDLSLTDQLTDSYSSILRMSGNRNWIHYNQMCKIIAELSYHGFTALNNMQTLGEEYTGIIQVDSNYITLPHKLIRLLAIILEFGGEQLLYKLLRNLENELQTNDDYVPEARDRLLAMTNLTRKSVPFLKALHRSLFYIRGGKYQISKRVTGINYVLVRHWLKENQSVYGYKVLGIFNLLQIILSIFINLRQHWKESNKELQMESLWQTERTKESAKRSVSKWDKKCVLCLEVLVSPSLTRCGHLFCWTCIIDWLGQKSECPVCREPLKKFHTVLLKNYG